MTSVEVVACRTGVARHAPDLRSVVHEAGADFALVDCFDKCETCERVLLVRVGGVMLRCRAVHELVAAIAALEGEG